MKTFSLIKLICASILLLQTYSCSDSNSAQDANAQNLQVEMAEIPVSTVSDEAKTIFMQGIRYLDLGDNQKARKYFNDAISKDPEFGTAYVYRSWTSASAEEFSADVKKANAFIDRMTEGEKLLVEIDNAYLTNDQDRELAASQKLVQVLPEVARAHLYLGIAFENQDLDAEAREHYEKAIKINPDWIGGHVLLANSYMFQEPKDLKKAEEHMLRLVELEPNEPRAQISLGDCYRAQNDLVKARERYNKAKELDQEDAVAFAKSGHVNSYLGNFDAARKDFKQGAELSDQKIVHLNFIAFTYLYEGNYKEAQKFLDVERNELSEIGVPKGRIVQEKMNCINSSSMIAMHHHEVEELKRQIELAEPLSIQIGDDMGTEEAMKNQAAGILYWKSIAAALDDEFKMAIELAFERKLILDPIRNINNLKGHNFLMGFIAIEQENYFEAVNYFKQADMDNVYHKYMLAKANEMDGKTDAAMLIYSDLADYNFNEIGYALIRKEVKEKVQAI